MLAKGTLAPWSQGDAKVKNLSGSPYWMMEGKLGKETYLMFGQLKEIVKAYNPQQVSPVLQNSPEESMMNKTIVLLF